MVYLSVSGLISAVGFWLHGEVWRVAGKDLKNVYFALGHKQGLVRRQAAGKPASKFIKDKWLCSRYGGAALSPNLSTSHNVFMGGRSERLKHGGHHEFLPLQRPIPPRAHA